MSGPRPVALPAPHPIAGLGVHPVRLAEVLRWIHHAVSSGQQVTAMYANAYAVTLAQADPTFRAAMGQADLVFCDGVGVRLASWLLGTPLPERFTPPDWIGQLAACCAREGYRLFLLGAQPEVVALAAERLRACEPTLQVAVHHGYFDPHSAENERVLAHIAEAAPQVMLVGMGMPRQEQWMVENKRSHSVPVVISVGALFDYLAGHRRRGPAWMTDHGLEWLCRLWYEPGRLGHRYLVGNPRFAWLILRQWWQRRTAKPAALHQNSER